MVGNLLIQVYNQIAGKFIYCSYRWNNNLFGEFKIHTFTGPGTFTVSCAGNSSGNDQLEYLVVAGGGGGGGQDTNTRAGGGGGGAGGFRESPSLAPATYPGKPLAGSTLGQQQHNTTQ